jgi:hypothetical protein
MALDNLVSVQLTDEEKVALDGHFDAIESILRSKCVSLTPEQRQAYGRLGNKSENWSRKVLDYMNTQPNLTPAFIDYDETVADFEARRALQPRAARGEAIMDMLNDTLLLLGSDVYHSCIAYYRNISLLARQNVNGAKAVYEDLAAQFPGKPKS